MKITLTDEEVRDAIEDYVRSKYVSTKYREDTQVHVSTITRHHGGTVSARVQVTTV